MKILSLLIKLCKNFKNFKWWDGFGFEVGTDIVIPYSYRIFDYREKLKLIRDQLEYYLSKSIQIMDFFAMTSF